MFNMASSSNSFQSTCPVGDECFGPVLDFTCNFEPTSGIFVP